MDAYCPHLGANMAVGGKVVNNDCLECPFHGWQFSGETGKLVNIPYAKKGNKSTKLFKTFSLERCVIVDIIFNKIFWQI